MTVEKIFAIANLAEKYQVDVLMKKVEEVAVEYPVLDRDDAVAIASTAREYNQFESLRDLFLTRCSSFLESNMLQPEDFVKLAKKFADTDKCETVMKLIAMMKVKNCRRGQPPMKRPRLGHSSRMTLRDLFEEEEDNGPW